MLKGNSNLTIMKLENESNSFWREINPSAKSCSSLIMLLEIYAAQEDWEQIINLSSRAVLHLSKFYDRADFYHIWICALKETFDTGALISLGKHLLKMRHFHNVFLSLALISFNYASCDKTCNRIFNYLNKNKGVENRFAFEGCGLYLSRLRNSELKKKGLSLLKKVCLEKKANYFTWRNYLRTLSENNLLEEMSKTYNMIHDRFPFAQEPYLVASLIAIDTKDWIEAIRVLGQILKDNPNNTNAILAMANCYYELNDYLNAISLLTLKSNLFLDNDYDFHFIMGIAIKKIVEKEFDSNLQNISLSHLEKCYFIAKSLEFPLNPIQVQITHLKSLNNEIIENESEINILKIHNENQIESDIVFVERKAG
ncbi:MAG: tetratricopeptide repeat protein [Silvanigrellaceae bacterium]|nr:tetratricopeptide repeat protein [Silvanigrellaceae bacterium]